MATARQGGGLVAPPEPGVVESPPSCAGGYPSSVLRSAPAACEVWTMPRAGWGSGRVWGRHLSLQGWACVGRVCFDAAAPSSAAGSAAAAASAQLHAGHVASQFGHGVRAEPPPLRSGGAHDWLAWLLHAFAVCGKQLAGVCCVLWREMQPARRQMQRNARRTPAPALGHTRPGHGEAGKGRLCNAVSRPTAPPWLASGAARRFASAGARLSSCAG